MGPKTSRYGCSEVGLSKQRTLRSLEGLSVGDAFGERFFGYPDQVVPLIQARSLPEGIWEWTDDTAMGLSVVRTLGQHGRVDSSSLALAFAREYAREPRRGYGRGAVQVLSAIQNGSDWRGAARALFGGMGSHGNGAAMRAGPVGAYFAHDLPRCVLEAERSAEVTHAHPDGRAGAIAVALAAAWAVSGSGSLLEAVLTHTPDGRVRDGLRRALDLPNCSPVEAAAQLGSGREVSAADTVPFALWCAAHHPDDYPQALWATVSGLGDRDTTCAIVGSIVALRSPVPPEWLRRREPLPDAGLG